MFVQISFCYFTSCSQKNSVFTDNITNVQHFLVQQTDLSQIVKMINRSVFMEGHTSKDLHAQTSQCPTQQGQWRKLLCLNIYKQLIMPRGSRNICMQSENTLEYAHCHNNVCNRTCLLGLNSCNSGFFFNCRCQKK